MIVLVITWTVGTPFQHTQAYGPWVVQEDGSHLTAIGDFGREWLAANPEVTMVSACMHMVTSPKEFRAR